MTFGKMKLSKMTLSRVTLSITPLVEIHPEQQQ
jgi:hypothetical protein